MVLDRRFVERLKEALRLRHVAEGIALLDRVEGDLLRMEPDHPCAAELLLLAAQWVDIGYRDHRFLDILLAKFPVQSRRRMPLDDYLRIRLAEAFRALSTEEADTTIDILDFVLKAEPDNLDHRLATLAHFWKGRAHRRRGEYATALKDIVQARERAQRSRGDGMLVAVLQIHEAWLLFQNGLRKEALRLLTHAETVLKQTDHYLALGNIESARGRIVRRSGEYAKALEHFDRAIAIYSAGDPHHCNLARTLVNAAYVRRVLALQLRKRIDAQARMPGQAPGGHRPHSAASPQKSLRARYHQICEEATRQLERAREIYESHAHLGGIGSVMLNSGYLHLDRGDTDSAALDAAEAFRIALDKNDHILMARARILQAATENARVEEQVGEDADTALHANNARQFSDEALELAQQTQNRRLVAGAHIARGATAANEFFQDWELAKRSASAASDLIGAGENDHLLDDLVALKSHIMRASGVNDTLRGWSEGMLGHKTFQQVTEEFAEIVIPKVWMREDRKISRVAVSLSISPKKVRRILRNAGFLVRD